MRHVKNRKKFCKKMLKKTKTELDNIVYSDECKIELYPKGRIYVRTTPYQHKRFAYVRKTFKEAKSAIHIWGCIKSNGDRCIALFEKNLNSMKYQEILEEKYLKTHKNYHKLMQDGAKCHTSKSSRTFLGRSKINYIKDWPAQSPDLNPIENLWSYLKNQLGKHTPRSVEELWTRVEEEFHAIPNSFIQKLYDSVPKRYKLCLFNKGSHTKY